MYLTIRKIKALCDLFEYPLDFFQISAIQKASSSNELYFSSPRQTGKSRILIFMAAIFALDGARVLYTAQERPTVEKLKERFFSLVDLFIEMGLVEAYTGKLPDVINFKSGGSVSFRTRGGSFSRGLTLDVVIFDEAQMVSKTMVGSVEPALTYAFGGKRPGKELFFGTPPTAREWNLYGKTPFAEAKISKNKSYVEISYGDYDPKIPITIQTLNKANPRAYSLSKATKESILQKRRAIGHEIFCNEYLGVWTFPKEVKEVLPVLGGSVVERILTKKSTSKAYLSASVGMDEKNELAYIVLFDGFYMEAAGRFSTKYGSVSELTKALNELKHRIRRVAIPYGYKGRQLKVELEKTYDKKRLELISEAQMAANLELFADLAIEKKFLIFENPTVSRSLKSFYSVFDERKGIAKPKAVLDEDTPLIIGFVNSVLDSKQRETLDDFNHFGSLVV